MVALEETSPKRCALDWEGAGNYQGFLGKGTGGAGRSSSQQLAGRPGQAGAAEAWPVRRLSRRACFAATDRPGRRASRQVGGRDPVTEEEGTGGSHAGRPDRGPAVRRVQAHEPKHGEREEGSGREATAKGEVGFHGRLVACQTWRCRERCGPENLRATGTWIASKAWAG